MNNKRHYIRAKTEMISFAGGNNAASILTSTCRGADKPHFDCRNGHLPHGWGVGGHGPADKHNP